MDDIRYLKRTFEVAKEARLSGNNPFGAILVDKNGEILLEMGNLENKENDATAHAEMKLASLASKTYDREFLASCTLYTNFEPCSMCSGAIYWANIGRVVYSTSEEKLLELTGDNQKNLTMSLDCRKVLNSGQKKIEVVGPFLELYELSIESHKDFWK